MQLIYDSAAFHFQAQAVALHKIAIMQTAKHKMQKRNKENLETLTMKSYGFDLLDLCWFFVFPFPLSRLS